MLSTAGTCVSAKLRSPAPARTDRPTGVPRENVTNLSCLGLLLRLLETSPLSILPVDSLSVALAERGTVVSTFSSRVATCSNPTC